MTNTHENEQIKKLLMVCSHLQTEGQDIDLNNTIVEEYRYKGGWHVPAIPTRAYTMTREFIRRLDR